jgi:hypothetical protein
MTTPSYDRRAAACAAALALLLTGCLGSTEDVGHLGAAPAEAEEASAPVDTAATPGGPVVVFDGDRCSYRGPAEVRPGTLELAVLNQGGHPVEVVVAGLDRGSTVGDLLQVHRPQPSRLDQPAFVHLHRARPRSDGPPDFGSPVGPAPVRPGRTGALSVRLEKGEHALLCLEHVVPVAGAKPSTWVARTGVRIAG